MNHDLGNDVFIPQLFTAVPALNEAASFLTCSNNFITSCFSDYSLEYSSRDPGNSITHAQELVTFSSEQTEEYEDGDCASSSRSRSMFMESSTSTSSTAPPPVHDRITRASLERPSQNTSQLYRQIIVVKMAFPFFKGLFSNHGPLYFVNTKVSFYKMGLACHIA
ncbi:hypothetical protein P3X46_034483 [Hevea brasiliensis]|uniref:Uncharacterized protein n=1 Tax=Hevea brasiliensis TaxID=3981 RepID=A0ABQ9K7W1_HEVBR|nr:hypothetical protein P3X46_034483 [Hevea brasiliensis]